LLALHAKYSLFAQGNNFKIQSFYDSHKFKFDYISTEIWFFFLVFEFKLKCQNVKSVRNNFQNFDPEIEEEKNLISSDHNSQHACSANSIFSVSQTVGRVYFL
jgi:hypothetical protein